jgi:LysM repeat protein
VRTGPLVLSVALAGLGALVMASTSQQATASSGEGTAPAAAVHEVHVEAGVLTKSATWVQRVEKGDTFSEIAQRHLGTAKRSTEIQRLNPKVDARSLKIGQPLLLPPKQAGGRWLDLFVSGPDGVAQPVGLGTAARLPLGPVRVFAVPHARLVVLRAAARGSELTEAALVADPEVAASAPLAPTRADRRTLGRVVSRLEVTGHAGRTLEVRLLEQQVYGAKGHRLAAVQDADTGGGLAVPLVLVLAGLIVFALVAVAARRMAALDPNDTPSAPRR